MSRFSVESHVRIIGGLAEYYKGLKVVVVDIVPDSRGLSHLNRYRVLISDRIEETFYEFQLAPIQNVDCDSNEHHASA